MTKTGSTTFKTTLKLITPELAEELLAGNVNNRHISKRQLERMVDAMKNDQWKANGETIKISDKGRLLDGQHRLTAVVHSGVSCLMLLCEGVEETAVDTIDIGKRRTFGDWLNINGEENPAQLSAALHKLAIYRTYYSQNYYVNGRVGGLKNQSYQDLEKLLTINQGLRQSISYISKSESKSLFDRSTLSVMHYLFSIAHPEKAVDFFASLSSGSNLSDTSPILVLRSAAIKWKTQNHKPELYETMTFIIRAWNAYVNGVTISHLRFNASEAFPEIDGLDDAEKVRGKPKPKMIGKK